MKTILYYLSFSSLYTEGETALKKLEQVLEVFEQNKDNVRLLWYQDPLMEKDAVLLPESVKSGYEGLVSRFQEKEFVRVFRLDREDMENPKNPYRTPGLFPSEKAALQESDAYYGDPGYLCLWFKNEKKPVMIQNLSLLSE